MTTPRYGDIQPHDVIQRSYDGGKTWGDYCTIRTGNEAATAGSMCYSNPSEYRIVRVWNVIFKVY